MLDHRRNGNPNWSQAGGQTEPGAAVSTDMMRGEETKDAEIES